MRLRTNEIRHTRGHRPILAGALISATAVGVMLGASVVTNGAHAAESTSAAAGTAMTAGGKKTTGDRGTNEVYQQSQQGSMEPAGAMQTAPDPRTTGDRGATQMPGGEEVYMSRDARRSAAGVPGAAGTTGDRGINTRMQHRDMQGLLDQYQRMLDEQQARLDEQHSRLEVLSGGVEYRTSGDRGVNDPYRPAPAQTPARFSGDAYTSTAPRTSGDRGVNRVYRDERLYRERLAQERERVRAGYPKTSAEAPEVVPEYLFLGVPGYEQPAPNQGPLTTGDRGENMPLRGDDRMSRYEPYRTYPAPRTSGDRGVNRVWRDEMLAREQARLDWEQRLLDSQQRRLDQLQRQLDRQLEQTARRTAGDRGTGIARVEQAPSIQRTLDQLFSQLDRNADDALAADEAKRLTIVWRNFEALDANGDGELSYAEFSDIIDEADVL